MVEAVADARSEDVGNGLAFGWLGDRIGRVRAMATSIVCFSLFSGFGYVVASHEKGLTVMEHMRTSVRQCYGWSLPYGVSVHGENDFDSSGLTNPQVARRLRMLARDLFVYGALVRGQFEHDLANGVTETFAARYR